MGSLKCLFGWPFWRPGCLSWKFFIKCLWVVHMTKLHWPEFHTRMTFWFCIMFIWWWVISYLGYLNVHYMLIKYVWIKSETLCMCHPFQSTCRPIWHRNRWSFHVYMMPLWNFLPHSGTTTWMNSLQGDSQRHGILWWYYVHKCRAMKGNQSELRPAWKSPWCNVNTPLE